MKKIWKKERKPVRDKKNNRKLVKDRTWASPTIAVILMTVIASTIAPTAIASMDLTRPSIPTMQPQPPSKFYGTVMVDGEYVSDGTVISAWISGTQYETTTTFTYEGESVYVIEVPGDDPDTPEVEGGVDGDTVAFKVGDLTANQTGTWISGSNVELDLTAEDDIVEITRPKKGFLYVLGREIIPFPNAIIIGGITIEVDATGPESGIDRVEFYINNRLEHTDGEKPYQWKWDEKAFGICTIKTIAYDNAGNSNRDSMAVFIMNS